MIAQAFLGSPRIVLLDEPTSALDPWGRRRLRDLVRARSEAGAAIVIASHNLSEVDRMCDELAVIADGCIVARGPMGSLTATRPAVRFDVSAGVIDRRAPPHRRRAGGRPRRQWAIVPIGVRELSSIGPAISDVLTLLTRHRIDVRRIVAARNWNRFLPSSWCRDSRFSRLEVTPRRRQRKGQAMRLSRGVSVAIVSCLATLGASKSAWRTVQTPTSGSCRWRGRPCARRPTPASPTTSRGEPPRPAALSNP